MLTFWMPVAVFFAWIVTMALVVVRAADQPPSNLTDDADQRSTTVGSQQIRTK